MAGVGLRWDLLAWPWAAPSVVGCCRLALCNLGHSSAHFGCVWLSRAVTNRRGLLLAAIGLRAADVVNA
eukprot:123031-Lingulodinium_polyedra.AAC.1